MKIVYVLFCIALITGCGNGYVLEMPPPLPKDGANGHSAAFSRVSAGNTLCTNGGTVLNAGIDTNDDFTLQLSEITAVVITCNGAVGATGASGSNGHDGVSPTLPAFTPVAILEPCGNAPNIYDEVFLKLSNGMVLASFSDNINGYNTRFSLLGAGTYTTTDGDSCTFTLDSNGNITNENHHY